MRKTSNGTILSLVGTSSPASPVIPISLSDWSEQATKQLQSWNGHESRSRKSGAEFLDSAYQLAVAYRRNPSQLEKDVQSARLDFTGHNRSSFNPVLKLIHYQANVAAIQRKWASKYAKILDYLHESLLESRQSLPGPIDVKPGEIYSLIEELGGLTSVARVVANKGRKLKEPKESDPDFFNRFLNAMEWMDCGKINTSGMSPRFVNNEGYQFAVVRVLESKVTHVRLLGVAPDEVVAEYAAADARRRAEPMKQRFHISSPDEILLRRSLRMPDTDAE